MRSLHIHRSMACTILAAWAMLGHDRFCAAVESIQSEHAAVVEKDAEVFGFKLHYREAGQGPVVILLHGLGGDGSRWTSTFDALSSNFRVIGLDQIGFGQSDKPLVNYNNGLLAEFLAEFMDTLGISKASLVGHSMGAYVAMYAAVHRPEIVERLVLVDGGGFDIKPRSEHLVRIMNSTTRAEAKEFFELMFYDKSRVTDAMVRENYIRRMQVSFTISKMQEARANRVATVSEDEARRISAPTLILWGAHDRLLEPSDAAALDRAIPDSRAVLIEKAGHIPQLEQPERFNRFVGDFLREKGPAEAPSGR